MNMLTIKFTKQNIKYELINKEQDSFNFKKKYIVYSNKKLKLNLIMKEKDN